jgi:glutaminase
MRVSENLEDIVAEVARTMAPHLGRGRVADYIPALARVDGRRFGIAVATVDGATAMAGDAQTPFSIQSISKVFTLTMALGRAGADLWRRVGHEPSGSAFNSIVQLEREKGIPRNPLINAGALVVTDTLLAGDDVANTIARITDFMRRVADDPAVAVDPEVAASERATGYRNASLANFLRASDNLRAQPEALLEVYFNQCALTMSCHQLARAGLFLAHAGVDPITRVRISTPVRTRRVTAIMMTCGHYDASGDVAFRVGLPGKSGVGGGILAIAPGRAAIAVWSPGLNPAGNSLVGLLALRKLASLTGWSVFQ